MKKEETKFWDGTKESVFRFILLILVFFGVFYVLSKFIIPPAKYIISIPSRLDRIEKIIESQYNICNHTTDRKYTEEEFKQLTKLCPSGWTVRYK